MFGLFKKKTIDDLPLIERMDKYHQVLNVSVCEYFLEQIQSNSDYRDVDLTRQMKIVSSIVNLIFGRGYLVVDGAEITIEKVMELAMQEIEKKPILMEVVIQSRRVLGILHYAKSGKADSSEDFAHKLMVRWGSQFPDAPNPSSYPELMNRFISSLSSRVKFKALQAKDELLRV